MLASRVPLAAAIALSLVLLVWTLPAQAQYVGDYSSPRQRSSSASRGSDQAQRPGQRSSRSRSPGTTSSTSRSEGRTTVPGGYTIIDPRRERDPARAVELYEIADKLLEDDEFRRALPLLQEAEYLDESNADVLNLLAYTQRHLGLLDQALANFHRALALRPDFPEAREYLGEAYLAAARRELDALRTYGPEGSQHAAYLTEAILELADELRGQGGLHEGTPAPPAMPATIGSPLGAVSP